jgi:hypothetical protein
MRKVTVVGVVGLAASLAFAATVLLAQSQSGKPASAQLTPLNVKTGLWQDTVATKYTGLPPQMAAALNTKTTSKICLKPKDLSPHEWTTQQLADLKCSSLTVLKSTGTELEVQGRDCNLGEGVTGHGHGGFQVPDSQHVTGSLDATVSGSTPFGSGTWHAHSDYAYKWLGATCPADMK